ncbi:BQ5605_C013g07269 [Microbotryum silenes-dioicae]|uniref:BQ5605_C013g07269 protein n=1 Tax=Microbotryum silenes-dioicae TaxID=796604 RepID=A0A2X0LVY7_9BASI|nr:BQ5605_C013g07269 [Microbotryum silenes-dioicae]
MLICSLITSLLSSLSTLFGALSGGPLFNYQGKLTHGRRSLAMMRGRPENSESVTAEYKEVLAGIEVEKAIDQGSLLDCFRGKMMLKRILCVVLAGTSQQLTGVSFVWYYSTQFFTQVCSDNGRNPGKRAPQWAR